MFTETGFSPVQVGPNEGFAAVKEQLEAAYPALALSCAEIDGEDVLQSEHGGMRVFWVFRGEGEVYLPEGYRTQEGDGHSLPSDYKPEPVDPAFAGMLRVLEERFDSLTADAAVQARLILDRRQNGVFLGDIAAHLWALDQLPRPWSGDPQVEETLEALFGVYRGQGYSVKQTSSYERVMPGDQLVACGDEQILVRGRFECMSVEKKDRAASHVSTARRLRFLKDTAGGCSFDFEPVRRLPLTWYVDYPGQEGDGVNFINAHVVNIPEELSSTHFHPVRPLNGGLPQTEMYLVLDPEDYGIVNQDRDPEILLFPDLRDLRQYERHALKRGDLVYIPPGVGHRGLDVFVNVLTIPGFKPHNEIYIDQDILDRTGGEAPYNENGLARKNYERLEDYL